VALAVVGALVILLLVLLGGGGDHGPSAAQRAAERHRASAALALAGLHAGPRSRGQELGAREQAALTSVLAYTPYISTGSTRKREVALTFDDGPSPYTSRIAAILKATRTPATFFVVGQEAGAFGPALRGLTSAGFVVGNHTQTHPMMASLGGRAQSRQIDDQAVLVGVDGVPREHLYRPPYGSYDRKTLKILSERRMLMVLWDVDTQDYARPGANAIVRRVLDGAKPGSIVLMHDGGGDRTQTVAALPRIIRGLRARGLRPVTVPQLLLDDPPPRNQGRPPTLSGG
jgi:peptidoglycan/xylan/chitin deacetylase (PgdA/CDA1 family)